ncbi:gap junction delta-3 protein isoform X2 [Gallus gallus]|uniref:gap junction delta-3 protein isoform X2 n=1 Tax=Gallus gallus TaxID=9031 RepID=UPI001F01F24A|nr:gap junction delta-3 protein isoform X2 [Gallus gallus]
MPAEGPPALSPARRGSRPDRGAPEGDGRSPEPPRSGRAEQRTAPSCRAPPGSPALRQLPRPERSAAVAAPGRDGAPPPALPDAARGMRAVPEDPRPARCRGAIGAAEVLRRNAARNAPSHFPPPGSGQRLRRVPADGSAICGSRGAGGGTARRAGPLRSPRRHPDAHRALPAQSIAVQRGDPPGPAPFPAPSGAVGAAFRPTRDALRPPRRRPSAAASKRAPGGSGAVIPIRGRAADGVGTELPPQRRASGASRGAAGRRSGALPHGWAAAGDAAVPRAGGRHGGQRRLRGRAGGVGAQHAAAGLQTAAVRRGLPGPHYRFLLFHVSPSRRRSPPPRCTERPKRRSRRGGGSTRAEKALLPGRPPLCGSECRRSSRAAAGRVRTASTASRPPHREDRLHPLLLRRRVGVRAAQPGGAPPPPAQQPNGPRGIPPPRAALDV